MKQKNSIIGGATWLGIATFFSKLLGAIYRVPLTALIGSSGLGLYQMVFPVYATLLDFSGAGAPSALSKLIATGEKDRHEQAYYYLRTSIIIFMFLGIVISVLMAVFSKRISALQGDARAQKAYLFLSPAILFVSLLSCFRGYFQGLMQMKHTAISQIIEQSVKLAFGLLFAYLLRKNLTLSVAGATLAISFSELIALLVIYITYLRYKRKKSLFYNFNKKLFVFHAKSLIKTAIPITLIGIAIPLSQVIDSFVIINLLNEYRADATSLYGLFSGVVMTVINLPVSLCYGIAVVAIPAVSGALNHKDRQKNAIKTMLLTMIIALPCAIGIALFSRTIVNILFGRLDIVEKQIASKLLKLTSMCVILSSFTQTTNAILIAKGKAYNSVVSLLVGVLIKTVINIMLVKNPQINVYGSAVGLIACYFIVCLINLIMIFRFGVANESKRACRREYAS